MSEDAAKGKTVLVTGATDGIGKATARALLRAGARVIVHGRSREKAGRVTAELRRETGRDDVVSMIADFASLAEVERLAAEIRAERPELQILVNNAGVYMPERVITEDGFEQTLQVQYLAPFLLTRELLPALQANAPSRIVNVTSMLHEHAPLELDPRGGARYSGPAAYAGSKLLSTMWTVELAERLRGSDVTVSCVHPGGVDTNLARAGYGGGGMSPEEGARPIVHLAAAAGLAHLSGRYFKRFKEADPDPRAYDAALRRRVWEQTERMLARVRAKAA